MVINEVGFELILNEFMKSAVGLCAAGRAVDAISKRFSPETAGRKFLCCSIIEVRTFLEPTRYVKKPSSSTDRPKAAGRTKRVSVSQRLDETLFRR